MLIRMNKANNYDDINKFNIKCDGYNHPRANINLKISWAMFANYVAPSARLAKCMYRLTSKKTSKPRIIDSRWIHSTWPVPLRGKIHVKTVCHANSPFSPQTAGNYFCRWCWFKLLREIGNRIHSHELMECNYPTIAKLWPLRSWHGWVSHRTREKESYYL